MSEREACSGRANADRATGMLEAEALARATAELVPYESPSGVLIGGAARLVAASA